MQVKLIQHPVGQGGMMSGLLKTSGGQLHWVYDCGSNQKVPLTTEIDVVAARGPIDFLFLSHLDSDHVNGVDRLLSKVRVKEVVLPYLAPVDRLVAAAHDSATGALSGTFLTLLGDAETWFATRGVARITYIMPHSDDQDGGGEGPDLPPGEGRGGEDELRTKWRAATDLPLHKLSGRAANLGMSHQRLETTACLQLQSGYGLLDWTLAPYAHRPSDERLHAFRRAMFRRFGPKWPRSLHAMVRDEDVREKIRDCYDLIWSDHNLVSMALYAGPVDSIRWDGQCKRRRHWHFQAGSGAAGWLGTGDMHLDVGRRRNAFLGHYGPLLDKVNVFTLPHHGSHRNFDPSLPGAFPNANHFVASAGPNGYGHPDKGVVRMLKAGGKRFVRVSEKAASALEWTHHS